VREVRAICAKKTLNVQNCVRPTVTDDELRTIKRPRKYVARYWLALLRPVFSYNYARNAYLLRFVGRRWGPVLRVDRRTHRERDRRPWADRPGPQLSPRLERRERVERSHARPA